MELFKKLEDYKEKYPKETLEIHKIQDIVRLNQENQRIQKFYQEIEKKNKISKKELKRQQFGAYQYSTSFREY